MPRPPSLSSLVAALAVGALLSACDAPPREAAPRADDAAPGALLPVPAESTLADPAARDAVRRGRAILAATGDSLPDHVGNALRCTSCHLDDGRRAGAMPWVGVQARYPQYRSREGADVTLEDRINGCLRRSMNGRALPVDAPAMRDMVAYMAFLSRDVPAGGAVPGQGVVRLAPTTPPDTVRGRAVYAESCARCHAPDGLGGAAPPLWGDRSFNVGAGMARLHTAAGFVRHNMPLDRPGTLSDRDALDVAAWLVTRPRPDFAGKENDWPRGGAPVDAAYRTGGER